MINRYAAQTEYVSMEFYCLLLSSFLSETSGVQSKIPGATNLVTIPNKQANVRLLRLHCMCIC